MNTAIQVVVGTVIAAAVLSGVALCQTSPAAFPTGAMILESQALPESAHPKPGAGAVDVAPRQTSPI